MSLLTEQEMTAFFPFGLSLCASDIRLVRAIESAVIEKIKAIIAQKDAEIARLRNQLEHYVCVSSKKAEQIKELEAELETERMRLAGCDVAAIGYFDGCKEEYRSASLDDTLRLYAKHNKQSAALKLAREALFDMQDSYAAVHGWKDSFVIAATTAIAAIDALGELE